MSDGVEIQLADERATIRLGECLGRAARGGDVVALVGPLGAGKTTLVQGLAAALGINGPVPSPTFVLIREYVGRLPLAHIDAYRLAGVEDGLAIGLDEYLPSEGVTAVEWAERIEWLLPETALLVTLDYDGDGRRARLAGLDLERWSLEVGS